MAIGWLALLQSVPWSEVIRNAPKVADGAKKLWNAVAGNSSSPDASYARAQSAASPGSHSIAALEARVIALEAAASDLHGQMLASSELLKALAEQNTQLIQRVEANRMRVLRLTVATVFVAIAALLGLIVALSRNAA